MAGKGRKLAAVPDDASGKRGGIAGSVQETLDKLPLSPEDAALRAVALGYASTIDRAAAIAAAAGLIEETEDNAEQLARLRAKVSAQVTWADLGPKLLAALVELGATPKSRAALKGPTQPTGSSRLNALREAGA
jgi:hypothetical protein